jgi:hypothetical protein
MTPEYDSEIGETIHQEEEGLSGITLTNEQMDYLRQTEGLNNADWATMDSEQRLSLLNLIESKVGEVTGYEPIPIVATDADLEGGRPARYENGQILVNSDRLADPSGGEDLVSTVLSETLYGHMQQIMANEGSEPPEVHLAFQDVPCW